MGLFHHPATKSTFQLSEQATSFGNVLGHDPVHTRNRLFVLFQFIDMLERQRIVLDRGAVDQEDVAVVGKFQDTPYIVWVELPNLVHHAMQPEIPEPFGCPFLKYVQKHNVHHCLHKHIGSIGPNI